MFKNRVSPQGTSQVLATGTSSTASAAFQATTHTVRLVATVATFVKFGSAPTADLTTSIFLPANTPELFGVTPGQKVAGILSASTGSLYITEGTAQN